jgi:hypothetical protein
LVTLAAQDERREYLRLIKDFRVTSESIATDVKYDEQSYTLGFGKHRPAHADGGITTQYAAHALAICAGAIPLSAVIKAARDVLIKFFDRGHIRVTLGRGRVVDVGNVKQLDEVLTRFEQSDLFKDATKPKAKRPVSKQVKAGGKPRQK